MANGKALVAAPVRPKRTAVTPRVETLPVAIASDPTPPAAVPAVPVIPPVAKDVTMDTNTMNAATEAGQAQAKAMFADVNDRAQSAVEKSQKMVEELTALGKGNVEALVESAKIAAKGAEDIARHTVDYSRQAIEQAGATAKQLAGAKSPTEFFQIHSDASRKAIDAVVAETSKLTETYLKLWGEIAQPVSNRVAVAMEKVKVAA